MGTSSDVKAQYWTASSGSSGVGDVFAGPARIKGIHVHTAGSGSPALVIKDGSGGSVVLQAAFKAADNGSIHIPDDGILCRTALHVSTLTAITSMTVFYA